ncbi:MAG: histidine kinase, partial [Ferruginibacter sp.]
MPIRIPGGWRKMIFGISCNCNGELCNKPKAVRGIPVPTNRKLGNGKFNFRRLSILFIIYIFYFAILPELNAQSPYFKNIVFDKEKKEAKLLKIFQDKKGYIWLGTNFGICRYDGINFKYLEKDSNQVSTITENNNGVLWLGHMNGVIEYVENNTVKKFMPEEGLPKIKITDIIFDKQDRLWFSTYGEGIYCYDKNILYNINHDDGLTDDNVYDLMADDDKVWAATDMGISICTFQNGKKNISVINDKNGLPDNIVRNMKKDADGNTWVALQDKGVCFFKKGSGKINVPDQVINWPYGQVNDVLPMKREVFIGTEEHGIIEIYFGLPPLKKMIPLKKKKINSIQQLLLDKNEQVWVVADNLLSMTNSNRFQLVEIPVEWQDGIKAMTSDNSGRIWFSNKLGIFVKKDNNSPVLKVQLPGNIDYTAVVCLYADYKMNIWIGTYNYGLYEYIPSENKLRQYTKVDGLVDNNVFSITGKGSEIWLGTLGGASKMELTSEKPLFQNYTKQNGLSNNYVYNVLIDSKGNRWFATDGNGISKLDQSGFHHYDSIPGLAKNIVYTTTEDIFGNIWFIGRNSGLFVFNGKTFKRYGLKDGLFDNDILNVWADNKGNLLLTHPDGLEIFNIKKEYFVFYGAESGFENINPEINAYCRTQKGAILVGATDKIIQYYAADNDIALFPELVMNSISIFFNPINFPVKNIFSHDENHVTFDYAGLWYTNPEAVNYQYQLEGYSKDWINTRDHIITFPNLPPSQYIFKVKASVSEDFRHSSTLTYSFFINRPYWKTTWFKILIVLVTGFLIYYFVRVRIRLIQYAQEKEKQKLLAKLRMLKNQLNPHFLFNSFNTLMNIIDKDKQLAMEFAEKLSDFYREIVLLQDKEMVTIDEELSLLKNYIYLQQKRFGNNLQLSLHIFDEHKKAGIPPLTLQLLAENALKHNTVDENNPLIIKIESAQSFLIVSNNITKKELHEKSAGIGLKNIQQRVQLL